ncbi:MAG: acyltransferase family protein [Sphingomicrobium sp.]
MATASTGITADTLVEPHPRGLTRSGAARLESIDMMRGLVIALMVLDHVRDFFLANPGFDPTDAARSWPALYLTRWVTHLCAPTFLLLSGVSIYLQREAGKTGAPLARFLVSRGLWLVLLECTLIMFAWNFGSPFFILQVIWAIGWSMVGMAVLAQLPHRWVLAIGIAIVALSPFALPSGPATSATSIVQNLLFGGGPIVGAPVFIAYAIVPWLGVMAIGFGLGPLFTLSGPDRRRRLVQIALALIVLFFALRGLNGYGNPQPWEPMAGPVRTAMGFFDIWKYPPSPDFIAITVGLSLLLLVAIEHLRGPLARILGDFGRTPLFTYVAHLYIAHGLMLATAAALGRPEVAIDLFSNIFSGNPPQGWGFSLWVVYAVWLLVLAILVPLSRWFAGVKRRRRDWWLSYL